MIQNCENCDVSSADVEDGEWTMTKMRLMFNYIGNENHLQHRCRQERLLEVMAKFAQKICKTVVVCYCHIVGLNTHPFLFFCKKICLTAFEAN